jgi:hypothetical protein
MQKLIASSPIAEHYFGSSVAVRGKDILVGAPGAAGDDAGEAAYFFSLNNGHWGLKSKQVGSGDFSRTVSLAGNFGTVHFGQSSTASDFAVIGSPLADRVSVYTVSSVSVGFPTNLVPTVTSSGERFGSSVAAVSIPRTDTLDDGTQVTSQINRIVVGAPLWDGQGRVLVFDLVGSTWTMTARLTAEGGLPQAEMATESRTDARFGAAVALDNQYVIVGAPNHQSGNSTNTGAAYVFYELRNGTTGANRSSWTRSTGGGITSSGGPGTIRSFEASWGRLFWDRRCN